MKRLVILSACLAISLAGWAQGNRNDSLRMDSIIHSLPDVMVKGNRPIVKVKGATLTYDLPQLIKNHPVDNAYEAIKQLPGVSEQDEALTLNAQSVTVMIDGKATTMTSEQLYSLLKTIPTSRIANAEVVYSAPARYQVKGQVINLLLKHNTGFHSLQGEFFGGYTHQNRNSYTECASLLFTNKKWEIDMLYSFGHGKRYYYYENEFAHTLTDGTSYASLHIATIPNVISTTTSDWESTIIWQRIINSALPTPHNSITREELQRMMAISHPFSESMPRVSFTTSAWITPHHSASRQEQNTPIIIHRMNNG